MAADRRCGVCDRPVPPGYAFRGGVLRCRRHVLRTRSVLRRSFITALIVGTVLTAINQGHLIVAGEITRGVLSRAALTYAVPFIVSTSGALGVAQLDESADQQNRSVNAG
jgi:hypothetical protein